MARATAAFRTVHLFVGLLLFLSGSYSTSGLSVSQRQHRHPGTWFDGKTIRNDYGDVVGAAGQTVDDGWGDGRTPGKIVARGRPEAAAEAEDGDDFRYVYREPDVDTERRETAGGATKRKSFMGLDNVDYVASTLDLHRTLVGGRNNNNNHNKGHNGPISGNPDEHRLSLATPPRHRTNHRPPMTSRFPLSSNVSPSDMRRMMKTLLDAGRR